VSSVSNGLYFLTLPLVSVMRVIIRCALSMEKYGISNEMLFTFQCSNFLYQTVVP
jgi:hypothetical protein